MKKRIVTLGVFDGVHRGHRSIFRQVIRRARQSHGTSLVYTFDPHPARVLVPQSAPVMIMTLSERIRAIKKAGIGEVVVQRFTHSFAKMSPESFFERIIKKKLKANEIFVGYDFTFGHHRSGSVHNLKEMGEKSGIPIHIVEPFFWKERLVSSTQIRDLLKQGRLPEANDLLTEPYRMEGTVIKGRGIGGKQLGIHTANLKSENEQILPTGVYITRTLVHGKPFHSVTNIGPNPTFGPGSLSVESHILNFSKNIRGGKIEIKFLKKIREEIVFSSAEELKKQIQNDIQAARKFFKNND